LLSFILVLHGMFYVFFGNFNVLAAIYGRSENVPVLSIVVAELEFRNIQRHIFGAHFMECADNAALKDGPETFDRVRVDCADYILTLGVINDTMRELLAQLPIPGPLVSAKQADFVRNGFANEGLKRACLQVCDYARDHIALAANSADDWGFTGTNTTSPARAALIPMLILFLATDESFVDLYNATKLLDIFNQGNPDLVAHFPSGLIGTKAHITHDLQRTHTFLANQHKVSDLEPNSQRLVRVLKDRPGNMREAIAGLRSALVALPTPRAVWQFVWVLGTTARATHAFGPSARYKIGAASLLIGKHRVEFGGGKLMDWFWLGHLTLPLLTERIIA
jgi:hypothetical protein